MEVDGDSRRPELCLIGDAEGRRPNGGWHEERLGFFLFSLYYIGRVREAEVLFFYLHHFGLYLTIII